MGIAGLYNACMQRIKIGSARTTVSVRVLTDCGSLAVCLPVGCARGGVRPYPVINTVITVGSIFGTKAVVVTGTGTEVGK